ncbi:MAG TPA: class I SAM-dependent methyltransferase [Myxococcaceae bacterium]
MTRAGPLSEQQLPSADVALLAAGRILRERGYEFTTITPTSHGRVIARLPRAEARTLRDVFGWSLPFRPELIGTDLFELLRAPGWLQNYDDVLWRSTVRFSSLGRLLLVHSAYPTTSEHAVFFGPDTYRFCALLEQTVRSANTLVDVGCGSGAGGLVLAGRARRVVLSDPNPLAVRFSWVNAELAAVGNAQVQLARFLEGLTDPPDVIVANPPYLVDSAERQYRHGGHPLGTGVALQIARDALERIQPGGLLVLYTGSPVVDGVDPFRRSLEALFENACSDLQIRELDPDVFGEELDSPAYADVERIALLSIVARKR